MNGNDLQTFDPMDGFCIHADPSGVMHIPGPLSIEAFRFLKENRKMLYQQKIQQIRQEREEHLREMNEQVDSILRRAREARDRGVQQLVIELPVPDADLEDVAEEWPFIEDDAVCDKCGAEPCVWLRYSHKACAYASRNLTRYHNLTNYQVDRKQSSHRWHLYRMCARMRNGGALGGDRIQLPDCVVNHVRVLFPSTSGNYVGFIDGGVEG